MDAFEQGETVGAGFGNSIANRFVEQAAIDQVTSCYVQEGWTVLSCERAKCGCDLDCEKHGIIEKVEVKGVSGTDQAFIITAGEVKQAQENPDFVLVVVTSALSSSPTLTRYTGPEFIRRFHLSALQYRAVLQR